MATKQSDEMLAALKKAAAILRDHGIPFAVGGGIAVWALGGAATEHDVDVVIKEEDVDAALEALSSAGMATARPPEGWLVKAWEDDVLIDLVFRPEGFVVDDELLSRCEERNIQAVPMRVLGPDEILVSKLLSLSEHYLPYEPLLEHSRSLREQVDWSEVRRRTDASPFARAFFTMVELLGIVEPEPEPDPEPEAATAGAGAGDR